jgi:anti-anti-sigma factor
MPREEGTMPLEIRAIDGGFGLDGELDLATAEDLLVVLREHPADERLTLDFSCVTFMDSSGLRALLQAVKMRSSEGDTPEIVLLAPTPPVRRVLDISLPDGVPGLEITS